MWKKSFAKPWSAITFANEVFFQGKCEESKSASLDEKTNFDEPYSRVVAAVGSSKTFKQIFRKTNISDF